MNTREKTLEAIKANQPELLPLPCINTEAVIRYDDVVAQFQLVLEAIGGRVEYLANGEEVKERIALEKDSGAFVVDAINLTETERDRLHFLQAHELEMVERAYIRGTVAVAENGAVWVDEPAMVNRLLPFICQHLVLVVDRKNIVATMHEAYQRIGISQQGFAVFIAGPSKTADIEQSLVLGAHGARTAAVWIVNGER